jgi:serine/threonine protein kinase
MADNRDDIYKHQPLWENRYIDMPIGRGSFGSVYKISREDMGHKYTSAVKIISIPSDKQYKEAEASFGGDEASLSGYFEDIVHNIVNEINMLYSLSGNSNIVAYQDHKVIKRVDRLGWDILIRMEYVTALKKYTTSHQMTKREITQLGIDICTGHAAMEPERETLKVAKMRNN